MKHTTPQVAAIHDLSGYGRASLTVVIPILSSMGIQVCPLPTAILSAHSEYDNFYSVDLTDHLQKIINHWKELNLEFDAIYSGYLGSHQQIEIVRNFIKDFRKDNQLIVVDPVMGDNGQAYPGITDNLISEMKHLCKCADIITPNLTEAGFLLNKDLTKSNLDEIKEAARALSQLGSKTVVITSVPGTSSRSTAVLAYSGENDKYIYTTNTFIPASYPGTGDAFTSVLTGALINDESLDSALSIAADFIYRGIKKTMNSKHDPLNGINQEDILPLLSKYKK